MGKRDFIAKEKGKVNEWKIINRKHQWSGAGRL